ncbi:MAG: YadA-like family protein [Acidaminococcaceae bacterium]|nr:YadA-like family protein [Acidaminococcaceae bacterium]
MNKVYKVIWSKVRNCYVVVSELAKRNGKNTGTTDKRRKLTGGLALAAMALTLNLSTMGMAEAAILEQVNAANYATDNGYITALAGSPGASASGAYSLAVGYYATAGTGFSLSEAQARAYNALQNTIKGQSQFARSNAMYNAVRNATDYVDLVTALYNVMNSPSSTTAAKTAANNCITMLNNRVAILLQSPTYGGTIAVGNAATAVGPSAIAVGNAATAVGPSAIAVGQGEIISREVRRQGTADSDPDNRFTTSTLTGAYGSYDIAIGKAAAYGNRTSATTGNFTNDDTDIGGYYTTDGAGRAIAVGYDALAVRQDTIAVGTQSMAAGQYAVAVGANARALTPNSVVIGGGPAGQQGVQGRGAINTPLDSPDQGGYSIAIGAANNFTYGYDNTDDYYANTKNSIAIGYRAHTHAANAFAIGISTDATAERSFAIGNASTSYNNTASHQGALASGQGSIAFGDTAIVVGDSLPLVPGQKDEERATHTSVNDAIAIGTNTLSMARNAVTLGGGMSYTYHQISADGKTMTNITQYYNGSGWVDDRAEGSGAKVGLKADGAVAIGGATGTVEGIDSEYFPTAQLTGTISDYTAAAQATVARSVALGTGSVANREAMNPIDPDLVPAYATSGYDVTTGNAYIIKDKNDKNEANTWMSTLAAVSIGEETGLYKDENGNLIATVVNTRQITGVAAGSADTDAVNVAQLKRVAERIAPAITIKAGDNITIDETTNAAGSIEYTIHAQGFGGTGTGSNISSDNRAVTLTPNKDTDEKSITSPYLHINGLDKAPTADYAKADGTDSIAIGRSATVTEIAPRGVAIGNRAMVNNKDAVALGSNASATNHFSVALGPNAEASIHTSVALGSHSVTTAEDKAGIRTGKYGYDVVTNSQYKGVDRFSPTWQSTAGSVSVGGGVEPATGDTVTRRISNVAAGIKDTDVVNVAQLKRATNYLTDHRSTSIGTNANGEREIVSPYLAMHGVEEAAQAKSLINAYGQVKDYTDALQKDISTLKGEKASLNRDVTNLTNQISDLDARMAAINDKKSEAYKDLANERAILNEEKVTLSKELNEVTEMLAEREGLLKTAETDYNKAKDLASDHAYVEGEKSFAQGSGTKVVGKESMAQGSGSTVIGDQSMAIGTGHEVYGSNSGAIGDPNVVAADESYAIGNNNNIGGVTKDKADIKTKNIFVYGNSNKIEAGKSHVYVLGSNVTTVESNSVILGNESAVYAEANNRTAGTGAYKSETINGKTYNYAGGDNEVGVVSVGNADAPRRIQNVAPGKVSAESTDAINGSQLYGAMTEMNNNVNSQIGGVEHRMKKGLAGAAALAALHPLDFDPDDKLTFAAGMGHYRGENAAALGMFYRPDEKVMFSVGGTMGNGENMINAGVSFSLDRTARVTGSRTALTKEVVQLREHVAKQDAQIAELTALVKQLAGNAGLNLPAGSALPGAPALFPDNLDNKWAYDTLEELEQKGYITGYAGRSLSRQQFAAALDMAMAGGAKLDERIVKEFEPELSHVRVAQVEGKGNYEGEWYERPRASHDRYEDKQKIEKKHFRVQEKKVTSKS